MSIVPFAIIGGSSTFSISFPEDLKDNAVEIIEKDKTYLTPFGESPPLTIFIIKGIEERRVVTVKMHGWRRGVTRADASRQIFWCFQKLGVERIFAEGGVGCINTRLKPGDLIIPDDYLDFSLRKDVSITDDYLLIMREPVCDSLKNAVISTIKERGEHKFSPRGVYAVTDGRHFESRAEVRMFGKLGADVVGQSFCPEVYLAREIGACYCGIYLIVNLAEGVAPEWDYSEFKNLFFTESEKIGRALIDTIKKLELNNKTDCSCKELRVKTLLSK